MKTLAKNKYLIILTVIVIALTIIKLSSSHSSTTSPDNFDTTQPGQLAPQQTNQNPISQPNNSQPNTSNNSSPTNPQSSPSDQITEVNYQIPLAKFLPYQGKYFRAQRYIGANNLEIIVSRQDQTDLAKQEAQVWFVQNGVDQLDRFTVTYR